MRPTGVKTARTTAPRRTSETSTPIRSASPARTPAILRSSGSRTSRLGRGRTRLGPGRCVRRDFHGHMIGTGPDAHNRGSPERSPEAISPCSCHHGGARHVTRTETPMGSPPRQPPIVGLPHGLVRRRDERIVAGVCAGVARWLGVDPIVVRLAVCILALANGAGLLVYLVAWAILQRNPPRESRQRPAPARARSGAASWPSRWVASPSGRCCWSAG